MRKLLLAAALVLMASGAQAATLNVVNGQLIGASGVLVDGSLYDVQFLDGTCIDLYSGCDDVSDFTFQTQASALLAAQALLDQVFLDGPQGAFDSHPQLTRGCIGLLRCGFMTPWQHAGHEAAVAYAFNYSSQQPGPDVVGIGLIYIDPAFSPLDTFTYDGSQHPYSVWSPIPEPSTALLLFIGLVGMSARRRV